MSHLPEARHKRQLLLFAGLFQEELGMSNHMPPSVDFASFFTTHATRGGLEDLQPHHHQAKADGHLRAHTKLYIKHRVNFSVASFPQMRSLNQIQIAASSIPSLLFPTPVLYDRYTLFHHIERYRKR